MVMKLDALRAAVEAHAGAFHCSEIHREANTRSVEFRHVGLPPDTTVSVPAVVGLQAFYATFSQLALYVDERSGDTAFRVAHPAQWMELDGDFRPWVEHLDEDEAAECLPAWINDCAVIGEVPHSGNYLLVPLAGPDAGKVFQFEHDGFEFVELGENLPDFVMRSLDPDVQRLSDIASHLRFIVPGEDRQWWIEEMRDNRGNVVRTRS